MIRKRKIDLLIEVSNESETIPPSRPKSQPIRANIQVDFCEAASNSNNLSSGKERSFLKEASFFVKIFEIPFNIVFLKTRKTISFIQPTHIEYPINKTNKKTKYRIPVASCDKSPGMLLVINPRSIAKKNEAIRVVNCLLNEGIG